MTFENIVRWSQRKGLDVLGTGDCLQPDWLREVEIKTRETGSGLLILRQEVADECGHSLPFHLRRSLRFVLSTEVCCAPCGGNGKGKLHHLLYFPSFASVHRFRARLAHSGNLDAGRPTLALTSQELLALVLEQDDACVLAPAHVLSPWNSSLGSVDGHASFEAIFGALSPHVQAVEMGSTATPSMCRQLSSLRNRALFCSSDAHSLENIGREYTLMKVEPTYDALMAALRPVGASRVQGFVKFPSEHTRNYYNFCTRCDRPGLDQSCLHCGGPLVIGSRDRAKMLADQTNAPAQTEGPRCQQLLPLAFLLGSLLGVGPRNQRIHRIHEHLLDTLGNERRILTEATEEEIADVNTTALAQTIVRQRITPAAAGPYGQLRLDF